MYKKPLLLVLVIFLMITGNPSAFAQSVEYDRELGLKSSKMVEAQMGIYESPKTETYLREIGQRLVKELGPQPFNYSFHIVDAEDPNAFALPAGYMYFSRGILLLANSESELAGVMGHEIIHSHKRHSVKSERQGILPAILSIPGAVVGLFNQDLGKVIGAPFDAGANALRANYSRKHEKQADKYGVELAADAGYDPNALATILENLSKEVEYITGKEEKFHYLDDHPVTPQRVKDINKTIKKLDWELKDPIASDQKDFFSRVEGIHIGPNPAQGVFREQQFVHADLNFTLDFPQKWATGNTPSLIGAVEPKGEAQLTLALAGPAGNPKNFADEFIKAIAKEYNIKPTTAKAMEVNGNQAYLVSIVDVSEGVELGVHELWVSMGDYTYQFISIGLQSHWEAIEAAMLSLREPTKEERNSLKEVVIKIVHAREGETIAKLSERTGNSLKADFTAIINDVSMEEKLEDNRLVKIGIKRAYKPATN